MTTFAACEAHNLSHHNGDLHPSYCVSESHEFPPDRLLSSWWGIGCSNLEVSPLHAASQTQLHRFNICRQFLQIFWDTDLMSAAGAQLDPHLWEGSPSLSHRSTIRWPRHGYPSRQAWRQWNDILTTTLLVHDRPHGLKLRRPKPGATQQTRVGQWTAFVTPNGKHIYTASRTEWTKWSLRTGRMTR